MSAIEAPTSMDMEGICGLTTAEASARWQRGEGNRVVLASSRTYWSIVRENLFTFLNGAFAAIGLVLTWLGNYGDAFLVVVVILGSRRRQRLPGNLGQ
ncbi:MAG: hypothetical protein HC918_11725, partial [Oscillatoriales cyanobacterium SM2_1_8]|nr:hypothetical protein [Oscillatoriales cyanobacterium SM2_1_8]